MLERNSARRVKGTAHVNKQRYSLMLIPGEKRYSVYGQVISTSEDLDALLLPSVQPANLHYVIVRDKEPPVLDGASLIYPSPSVLAEGPAPITIWRHESQYRVRFLDVSVNDLTATSITSYPSRLVLPEDLNITLLGGLFAFWLEMRGILALHASAVTRDGRAIGFLSHSGSGKSTLAAALQQVGYSLVTDDILSVEPLEDVCIAHPSYPRMRLWEDEARYFLGHFEELEQVFPGFPKRWITVSLDGFGAFCNKSQPLGCLYLPQRTISEETITETNFAEVSPRDAVIELMRYSFVAPDIEAFELQRQRLEALVRVARQVRMRRVTFPSGLRHVPYVRDAILKDAEMVVMG